MTCTGRCRYDVSDSDQPGLVAHHEFTLTFDDIIELVLVSVCMWPLGLPGIEAVQAEQQTATLEHSGLEQFFWVGASMGAVVRKVRHALGSGLIVSGES